MKLNIIPIRQVEPKECTMVCLRMILNYYDVDHVIQDIYKGLCKEPTTLRSGL